MLQSWIAPARYASVWTWESNKVWKWPCTIWDELSFGSWGPPCVRTRSLAHLDREWWSFEGSKDIWWLTWFEWIWCRRLVMVLLGRRLARDSLCCDIATPSEYPSEFECLGSRQQIFASRSCGRQSTPHWAGWRRARDPPTQYTWYSFQRRTAQWPWFRCPSEVRYWVGGSSFQPWSCWCSSIAPGS